MKKILFALALAAFALAPMTASAQNEIWHRASGTEWAGGLAGKAHQPGGYYLFNEGFGSAVDFPLHELWRVADWTGGNIPQQAANQASLNATHYGSTSFNMGGGQAGVFLNAYGHGNNLDYKIDGAFGGAFSNPVRNWSFGPESRVCFATRMRVQHFYGNSEPKVQGYFSVFIHDLRLNKSINMTIKLWANRPDGYGEHPGEAEVGKYISSIVKDNAKYTTKVPGSDDSIIGRVPVGESPFFSTCITRANLAQAVADFNEGLPEDCPAPPALQRCKASWDLNDYAVTGAFVQTEVMDLREVVSGANGVGWTLGAVRTQSLLNIGVLWQDHSIITRW